MTWEKAREKTLESVPDAESYYHKHQRKWFIRSTNDGRCSFGYGHNEQSAWISAANSDRVKQFYKEA